MYKLNLLENAEDSLKHSLQHLGPVKSRKVGDWKRIIIDLAQVIELLLKEKLRLADQKLLFRPNGNTISAYQAEKLLVKKCIVSLSEEEIIAAKNVRDKRNDIIHYEFEITEVTAMALVGQALLFILNFSEKHLNLKWRTTHLSEQNWLVLWQYSDFYSGMLDRAYIEIEESQTNVIACSICKIEAFSEEEQRCLVCGYMEEVLICALCRKPYLFSSCEHFGDEICPSCEYQDGYASVNHEKY